MLIPKIAHRIWFGEPFPKKYQEKLVNLVKLNPDYHIKFWSDSHVVSKQSYEQLQQWCAAENIELCDIRDYPTLLNFHLIQEELETSKTKDSHKRVHYVRASDIARIAILYKEGGVYTDTDSNMHSGFGELTADHGILIKLLDEIDSPSSYFTLPFNPRVSYRYFFTDVQYDFIVSAPKTELLKATADITQIDYQTYRASKNKEWENSCNALILLYGTIKLTGTALKRALNYFHQTNKLPLQDPTKLLIDTNKLMASDNEKSWLEGFELEYEDNPQLNEFCDEIEQGRDHQFPITHYGKSLDLPNFSSSSEDYARFFGDRIDIRPGSLHNFWGQSYFRPTETVLPEIKLPEIKLNFPPISLLDFQLEKLLDVQPIKLDSSQFTLSDAELINRLKSGIKFHKKDKVGLLSKLGLFNRKQKQLEDDVLDMVELQEFSTSAKDSAEDISKLSNANN